MLSVGDEVVVGQLRNCIVEEVLYDGKIYRVSYDREERDLGLVHDENYFTWTDLRKRDRIKQTNLLAVDSRIVPNYSQRQLDGNFIYGTFDQPAFVYDRDIKNSDRLYCMSWQEYLDKLRKAGVK